LRAEALRDNVASPTLHQGRIIRSDGWVLKSIEALIDLSMNEIGILRQQSELGAHKVPQRQLRRKLEHGTTASSVAERQIAALLGRAIKVARLIHD
jgi:hypothetical protein